MSEAIREILEELGYTLKDFGRSYRAKPLYRDSNNNTSLSIDKQTGNFVDFSASIRGSIDELVKITLNLNSIEDAQTWVSTRDASVLIKKEHKPKLKYPKSLDRAFIENLTPDYSYWIKRGISEETLKLFGGGVCNEGKMRGRYVFPVYNSKEKLIGVAGRDLWDSHPEYNRPKWKLIAPPEYGKHYWIYPFFVNYQIIRDWDEIVLVESVGDMLALWEAGVKCSLVLFGTDLGQPRLVSLLKLNPKRIIVALNNDSGNGLVGNLAAEKVIKQLSKHFAPEQIINGVPDINGKKDFGEMSKEEILEWKAKLK